MWGLERKEMIVKEMQKNDLRKRGVQRKREEMWQDLEMDALVKAYQEVHMKLAATGNKWNIFSSQQ